MEEQVQEAEVKKEEAPPPPPPEKPKTRDEIKKELQAKPEHKRTAKESRQLRDIEREEKEEKRHGALIHNLAEAADKWGRKQITGFRRTITDRVKGLTAEKTPAMEKLLKNRKKAIKELDKETKAAMCQLQEQHNKDLAEINQNHDSSVKAVNELYSGHLVEAERELEFETAQVSELVGEYTTALQGMTVEQLETLDKEGMVEVAEGDFVKAVRQ